MAIEVDNGDVSDDTPIWTGVDFLFRLVRIGMRLGVIVFSSHSRADDVELLPPFCNSATDTYTHKHDNRIVSYLQ